MNKEKKTRQLWVASSHLTESKEQINKLLEFNPDGIVIKSALFLGQPVCKRKCKFCRKSYKDRRILIDENNAFTYYTFHESQTCEYLFSEEVCEILSWLRREHPQVLRVASIIGKTREEILWMAKLFEKEGAQAIEFNSQKYLQKAKVFLRRDQLGRLEEILRELNKSIEIPVYVKLGPELLADEVFRELTGKAYGVTIVNSIRAKATSERLRRIMEEKGKDELIIHGDPLWP